jgi:RecJ-like exonuclease
MNAPAAVPCLGCKSLTTGSIGATGMRWAFLCQPCKDKADAEAAQAGAVIAKSLATAFDAILGDAPLREPPRYMLNPDKVVTCIVCDGYGAAEHGDGTLCMHCSGQGEVRECHECGHDYERGARCKMGCK